MKYITSLELKEKFKNETDKFPSVKVAAAHFGINQNDASRYRSSSSRSVYVPQRIAKYLGYKQVILYEPLDADKELTADDYMIGQRVILNKSEIGTIVKSPTGHTTGIWVFSPEKGYESDYAVHNIRPLPNGQL